jgi:hypothetical protein
MARAPASQSPTPTALPTKFVTVAPTIRKVVVPLPFVAKHVTFDDSSRDLEPATDVVAFDVPAESGVRHLVSATALDDSRAEGYVRESDGIARAEGDGFSIVLPSSAPIDVTPSASASASASARRVTTITQPAAPAGTSKNGFTRLR